MRGAAAWGGLLAAVLAGAPAGAQAAGPAGGGPPAVRHEVSARLRPRVSTTSVPDAPPAVWELARLRLQGRLAVGRVGSRLQLDYEGGEWSVDDAWVRFPAGAAEVTLGQAKRPFTVLSMRGGSRLGPLSRGASIRGADPLDEQNLVGEAGFGDRAVGVQLSGRLPFVPLPVDATAGLFPADPWDDPLDAGGVQGSVRMTARVAPGLVVGNAWSARLDGGPLGAPPAGRAVGLDVEAGDDDPGLHLLAEVVAGTLDGDGGGSFRGAHAWLMYRTGEHGRGPARLTFEPLLRWSATGGAAPGEGETGTLLTSGLNVYAGNPDRWNRLMVDFDLWVPRGGGPPARSVKVGMQVGT